MTGTDVRAGSCGYLLNQQTLIYRRAKAVGCWESESIAIIKYYDSDSRHTFCILLYSL